MTIPPGVNQSSPIYSYLRMTNNSVLMQVCCSDKSGAVCVMTVGPTQIKLGQLPLQFPVQQLALQCFTVPIMNWQELKHKLDLVSITSSSLSTLVVSFTLTLCCTACNTTVPGILQYLVSTEGPTIIFTGYSYMYLQVKFKVQPSISPTNKYKPQGSPQQSRVWFLQRGLN